LREDIASLINFYTWSVDRFHSNGKCDLLPFNRTESEGLVETL